MKILFTGGGTLGHLNPAIAVAEGVRERYPECDILFIGRESGEENRVTRAAGFAVKEIPARGFSRGGIRKRLSSLVGAIGSTRRAGRVIKEFSPDLVFATGGYVSFPSLAYATLHKIPTVIHESNAYPGLVTRLFAKSASRVLINLDGAREHLKGGSRVVTVGNPIRSGFLLPRREEARRRLGVGRGERLILSFGGSGGAVALNRALIAFMKEYAMERSDTVHIHATGRKYFEAISREEGALASRSHGTRIIPFIEDMPSYLCAADLVISRSGAMTVSEILALGARAILIPSPNVTDDHQTKNAEYLAVIGRAAILRESELTVKRLCELADRMLGECYVRPPLSKDVLMRPTERSVEIIGEVLAEK